MSRHSSSSKKSVLPVDFVFPIAMYTVDPSKLNNTEFNQIFIELASKLYVLDEKHAYAENGQERFDKNIRDQFTFIADEGDRLGYFYNWVGDRRFLMNLAYLDSISDFKVEELRTFISKITPDRTSDMVQAQFQSRLSSIINSTLKHTIGLRRNDYDQEEGLEGNDFYKMPEKAGMPKEGSRKAFYQFNNYRKLLKLDLTKFQAKKAEFTKTSIFESPEDQTRREINLSLCSEVDNLRVFTSNMLKELAKEASFSLKFRLMDVVNGIQSASKDDKEGKGYPINYLFLALFFNAGYGLRDLYGPSSDRYGLQLFFQNLLHTLREHYLASRGSSEFLSGEFKEHYSNGDDGLLQEQYEDPQMRIFVDVYRAIREKLLGLNPDEELDERFDFQTSAKQLCDIFYDIYEKFKTSDLTIIREDECTLLNN